MAIALCVAAVGLAAQTGLFGISFEDPLAKADSLLSENGFVAREIEGSMVKYYSDVNPLIDAVIVFVDQPTERVVGWFVKYSSNNTEEQDHYVVDRLSAMHGESNYYDKETQQLIWAFSSKRSLHVVYVDPKSLTVLYRDSDYEELFKVKHLPPPEEEPAPPEDATPTPSE
jgi:hypothetical protein